MLFISTLFTVAAAANIPLHALERRHTEARALPDTWYHRRDHPSHNLFRRGPTDGNSYPDIGTPQWAAGFPDTTPANIAKVPQAWLDALNKAVAAGKIPDIPPSTLKGGNPTYPAGNDPNGPTVCSTTYQCRNNIDIWDAPDGVFASSFDDGPLEPTSKLVQFLDQNNVTTTHFMIGSNIIGYPKQFKEAFDSGNDIAVHTYSHPYMTSLNNVGVLGEIGWTMQIIHNSTGGRIPRYWRPPYGDSDNRVSAIAREVFGLQTVIWNHDTNDWSIGIGGTTLATVNADLSKWLQGPKSPGLVILEHELMDSTVQGFINAFPQISSNGWQFKSLVATWGGGNYQNSDSLDSPVIPAGVLLGTKANITTTVASSASATASALGQSTPSSSKSAAMSLNVKGQFITTLAASALCVALTTAFLSA